MSAIPGGVRVQGFIAPTSSNDTYPVTDPHYGLGGLRTVLNLGQRDQIPAARRVVGMLVFVQQLNKYYKLLDDLVQWEEVDLSNILTNESDPTVPLHVKRIPAGNANGQILRWNGADWVLAALPTETDPTVPTHVKQIPQGSTSGQFLRWNGTQWTAADGSQLPAGTQAGQILQWNGTTWQAVTPPPPAAGGITEETDPTVPTHVKQIPQGTSNGQILQWNGTTWQAVTSSAINLISSSSLYINTLSANSRSIDLFYSGVTAGTYGDSNNIPVITVDNYGRVIHAHTVPVAGSGGSGDNPIIPAPPNVRFDNYDSSDGYASFAYVIEVPYDFNLPIGYQLNVEFRFVFASEGVGSLEEVYMNMFLTYQWASLAIYHPSYFITFYGYFTIQRIGANHYRTLFGMYSAAGAAHASVEDRYEDNIFSFSELFIQAYNPNSEVSYFEDCEVDAVYITPIPSIYY